MQAHARFAVTMLALSPLSLSHRTSLQHRSHALHTSKAHFGVAPSGYQRLGRILPLHTRDESRPLGIVVRGSKDDLENQLDLTQKTLDRVLAAVQAAQAEQNQAAAPFTPQDGTLAAREQLLWDRQQAMLDRMQQQWEADRQAWLEREKQLLSELAALRTDLRHILAMQTQQQQQQQLLTQTVSAASAAVTAVPPPASDLATYGGGAAFGASAASVTSPAPAKISGPSTASAAVAEAIRAVRDQHINPPLQSSESSTISTSQPETPEDTISGANMTSWQDLFPGAAKGPVDKSAADSVAAAMAAVDATDVLANLDLSYGSSSSSGSRRRRRAMDSNGSSTAAADSSSDEDDSSSSTAATPAAAAAAAVMPVENKKGDPAGPPPVLSVGDDDIFWVSKLHDGLMAAGFYPSDEELESWLFSDGTQTALLSFQACNDVPETGVTCEATWRKLMGNDHFETTYGHLVTTTTTTTTASSSNNGANQQQQQAVEVLEEQEVVTFTFPSPNFSGDSSSSSNGWPVLMDMDGGREVHALQVLLAKAGFNCGDDEMRWWQFGSATVDALKTFQACNGLPESGVCDERTWLQLLGPDAKPEDLEAIQGDESMYEDDMAAPHEGAVWLLGEQRWSKPVN